MPDTHYEVDESKYHARKLMDEVRELTARLARLDDVFAAMSTMKNGDGTQAAHFQKVVDLYGVNPSDPDNADKLAMAKSIYDELNSAQGNSAALRQFLARLG
jgi:hypothetical protein